MTASGVQHDADVAEVDRKKHDLDVIERVIDGVRTSLQDEPASDMVIVDVHRPAEYDAERDDVKQTTDEPS